MKYRKLRIAWSVGCGLTCLLLVVLWVRSYTVSRGGELNFSSTWGGAFSSDYGELRVSVVHLNRGVPDDWFIAIHYSLLFMLSAIAGALSWLQWSKRFTVRALLIATTLVAAVLGLAVYAIRT